MCPSDQQLQAYFDQELRSEAFVEVDAHVKSCSLCQEQLRLLQVMSAMFAGVEPHLSQMSRARLHKRLGEVMDRGLVRLAWSLSGIAAAVLVGGMMWMQTGSAPVQQAALPQAAPPWVDAMAASHPFTRDTGSPAAEFYLADASLKVDDVP
jgi:anti-sigma factor RsiW